MSDDDDLLREFLVESRENLDRLEHELLAFEDSATSAQMIDAVFRTAHTVKGTAGFFGFEKLQHLMHTAENLLARVRDGELTLTSPMVSCLLDTTDAAREILTAVEARAGEGTGDTAPIIEALTGFGAAPPVAVEAVPVAAPPPPAPVDAAPAPAPAPVAVERVAAPPEPPAPRAPEPAHAAPIEHRETSVRVDTGVLDRMMDLAGELVLARNQLVQVTATTRDPALTRVVQRIDAITSELQDGVMRTRMQPIAGAWAKLPRVVRDLATELGKQIELDLVGQDTALDRTVLEAIRDPLTHLVRNACDHGIERPERRTAAGKPACGTLRLTAQHGGGCVTIEITDDGGGIDPHRVRQRAVERGILSPERAASISDADLVQLIFAPGFSTAEKVTSVSGRGVGMDVVKTNVQAIGGSVTVHSRVGEGTTVHIAIPLTLAILPALLVVAGGGRYAIPESSIVEILRVDPDSDAGDRGAEYVHGAAVYRRRGELIPLVVLADVLAGARSGEIAMPTYIVVVRCDGRKLGIVVDELGDSEEIVVKPLSKHLHAIGLYAGATILGDGSVALILEPRGVASTAGVAAPRATAVVDEARPEEKAASTTAMLVVRGRDRRLAVPLSEVLRLEEVPSAAIERAGQLEVLAYRERLLPLLRLADPGGERTTVVVHTGAGRPLGLIVDGILDITDTAPLLDASTASHGVRGSTLVGGHVTDVVDVAALAAAQGLS